MSQSISDNEFNRLEDNVTLIINGLNESGRVLAQMLAKQGSDVAIVDSKQDQDLARRIMRDVISNGRRCLILTAATMPAEEKSFPQHAIEKIVDTFGHLDAFISYSDTAPTNSKEIPYHQNGRQKKSHRLFDQGGLTIAAMRHVFNKKNN